MTKKKLTIKRKKEIMQNLIACEEEFARIKKAEDRLNKREWNLRDRRDDLEVELLSALTDEKDNNLSIVYKKKVFSIGRGRNGSSITIQDIEAVK